MEDKRIRYHTSVLIDGTLVKQPERSRELRETCFSPKKKGEIFVSVSYLAIVLCQRKTKEAGSSAETGGLALARHKEEESRRGFRWKLWFVYKRRREEIWLLEDGEKAR